MAKTSISIDHIARIEGHGNVHVVIEEGAVKTVEMNIVEPARLFESMVKGRSYREVSYIASRICGICSASHVVTDLKAIERIFGVELSERSKKIRELLIYGSYLQNHASHLFVFVVPDFVGYPSVFPLAESNPELFEKALGLKSLGNELCTKVGGRSIHPITAVVGGFTHEMSSEDYLEMAEKLEAAIPFAHETADLFSSFRISEIQSESEMLALVQPDYYPVQSSDTIRILGEDTEFISDDLHDHIEEYEQAHSGALFARTKASGKTYMTSALARINASWSMLSPDAKVVSAKVGLRPPELNTMKNNLAQAVELVDALNRCAGICRELAEMEGSSKPVDFEVRAGRGIGVTEAPRGLVFHELELDDEGRVVHASIMTPTAQNLAAMENDIRQLVEMLAQTGLSEDLIRMEIAKLVRAYDPCLSCSVH